MNNRIHADEVEDLAVKFFKDQVVKWHKRGLVDLYVSGVPVEVKSCKWRVKDKNSTRKGRFHFRRHQHEFLVKHGGYYFLVVRDETVNFIRFVRAEELKLEFKSDEIVVSWVKVWG